MKIAHELGLLANYKIIRASYEEIAEYIVSSWGGAVKPRVENVIESLKTNGWAVAHWLHISKQKALPTSFRVGEYHNLVPSILRDTLAANIAGSTVTPTYKANYMALGDDGFAATNEDTTLYNETLRGLFTNRYSIDNVAYLDKFFSTAEVAGNTYNEAGVFVDGSAGANTGYLLSRVIISETMGANETLTINASFTIT